MSASKKQKVGGDWERTVKACQTVLKKLMTNPSAGAFLIPVSTFALLRTPQRSGSSGALVLHANTSSTRGTALCLQRLL